MLQGWIVNNVGDSFHYVNDIIHNDNGPACINVGGTKNWYVNGLRHRENGPAIEWSDGGEWWFKHGKLHRENGPAIYEKHDATTLEWWHEGVRVHCSSNEEFIALTKYKAFM